MDIDFWNINAETAKPFGKAKKYITVKEIMEAKEKIKLHEKINMNRYLYLYIPLLQGYVRRLETWDPNCITFSN